MWQFWITYLEEYWLTTDADTTTFSALIDWATRTHPRFFSELSSGDIYGSLSNIPQNLALSEATRQMTDFRSANDGS